MKSETIIKGVDILDKYRHNPSRHDIIARGNEIEARPTDKPVTSEDVKKLIEDGWFQVVDPWEEITFKEKHYDPSEPWILGIDS